MMKKKVLCLCLTMVLLMCALLLTACGSDVEKYELVEIQFSTVSVEDYNYNYIEFDRERGTYKLENRVKSNHVVSRQSGDFFVDAENNVAFTNKENPAQNYILYQGEIARFIGNKLRVDATIPGYGDVYMVFENKAKTDEDQNESADGDATEVVNLCGTWTVLRVNASNSDRVTNSEMELFKETVLILNEDKTGSLNNSDETLEFDWMRKDSYTIVIRMQDGSGEEFSYRDGILTIPVDLEDVFVSIEMTKEKKPDSDESDASEGEVHEHDWETDWLISEEDACHYKQCVCGETWEEAHTFGRNEVTQEPTHTATGTLLYICEVCGEAMEEMIPANLDDHSFGTWKADSTDNTVHTRSCACGAIETEEHRYGEGIVTQTPTHTTEGIRLFSCELCGAMTTETIPKNSDEHSYGDWKKLDGDTHQRTCACGEKESEAHHFDNGVVTQQPTETVQGTKTYTCADCGAIKTESLPIVHRYHEYLNKQYYNEDYHIAYCICGASEMQEHGWYSEIDGNLVTWTCGCCGATKSEEVTTFVYGYYYVQVQIDEFTRKACRADSKNYIMSWARANGLVIDESQIQYVETTSPTYLGDSYEDEDGKLYYLMDVR